MTVDEAINKLQELSKQGYGDIFLVDSENIIVEDLLIDEDNYDKVWVAN